MFAASTNAEGRCTDSHDVCQESVVRDEEPSGKPYINQADNRQIDPNTATSRVKIQNMAVATTSSQICHSAGDQFAEAGGVVSGDTRGGAKFQIGSGRVLMEGAPAAYHGSRVVQHGASNPNAPFGKQTHPSQSLVYVAG